MHLLVLIVNNKMFSLCGFIDHVSKIRPQDTVYATSFIHIQGVYEIGGHC